ncbi:nucleoside deaminase [Actinospica durhamensis]|uniref:Nucleoside deaminase n=1 Tax=Actinospica durhamensis TaxID=1508375 RepID=A0A941IWB1_9ACTN|nr:nucleoside deaminase [Actinospica durhamensis]MBR7838916.1 nucleoside deaminase [Actinospica durhamensis]
MAEGNYHLGNGEIVVTEDQHRSTGAAVTEADVAHLRRCVELATEAVDVGDWPFGSVLVGADGSVLAEDRNRETTTGDATRHPEFELARWAATHLDERARAGATVYTSGEHCPMCSAAHAWVGLGRIVFASSSRQSRAWVAELGVVSDPPVRPLSIREIAPGLEVVGPVPEFADELRALHHRFRKERAAQG